MGNDLTTANNVICIGAAVGENVSDSCFIGNIWNQPGGSQGRLCEFEWKTRGLGGTSRRFKDEIKPMKQGSDVTYHLDLEPVSFRYRAEIDSSARVRTGR